MEPRWVQRHLPAVSVAATLAAIVVLSVAGSLLSNRMSESLAHGLGHAAVGVPVAVLGVVALWAWPQPAGSPWGRAARRVVVGGLFGVATGQLLELLGARVGESAAHAIEEVAHTAGQIVTMLSMLVLLAGAGLAAASATRSGRAPKWLVAVGIVLALAIFVFLFAGAPGS